MSISPLLLNMRATCAMLGANVGIDDIDAIAEMDRLCGDFGLDTIETGGTLAVAAEAGLMHSRFLKNSL